MRLTRHVLGVVVLCLASFPLLAQQLEIHYIDVGWGGSVFIKGPDGTTVLLEAGNTGMGTNYVVPYLKSIGVQPASGIDYVVGGHQHCDHIGGLDEVINAGYNVHIRQYSNGSSYASTCVDGWNAAAATTTAGAPVPMPVGTVIPLGNGATITCIARNGSIIGGGSVSVSDENDRSIALLIKYGGFDYLWASDLGGGSDSCTGRSTSQTNVETSVIGAISPGGASPLISAGGIDVLHVNHHGSESSTNPDYFNMADPSVAIIGVGDGESSGWDLPRIDVVEHVLLGQSSSCITAPPTLVLQTEEGNPIGSLASHAGYCVGNITITTDGLNIFTVSADGAVHQGPSELTASSLPQSFTIDDSAQPPDTTPPTVSITAPANGATVSGTTSVTASASDDVGVSKVEFYLDGTLQSTDPTSPYAWSWNTTMTTNGGHALTSMAYDAAGNRATSAAVNVTVNNMADTTPPTAPANLTATAGKRKISLSWSASTDNVGVTGYQVWRASSAAGPFSQIATSTSTTYTNSNLTSRSTWYYYVMAADAAGNVSAASNTASATAR
ncbi:MAG TPA: Ig-like domain-containing protein [Thermoanaerobaculia bacterium]|nr:Ig-like domain-containing protein [Thermoanaerobaculia bacterium]